jgi:uncharacterized protein YqeY
VSIQEQIESDLKTAMLAGDKTKAMTLRGVKSALLNEAISQNARETGLTDDQIQKILAKESKKRQEAADLYKQVGAQDRASAELAEKTVIDGYLPEQMGEEQVAKIVDEEVAKVDNPSMQNMGQIIGAVRQRSAGQADGSVIARLVKEKLSQ